MGHFARSPIVRFGYFALLSVIHHLSALECEHGARMKALDIWHVLAVQRLPDVVHGPTSIFSPDGTPARSAFGLSMLVLSITLGIFLIVGGLLFYALIRFRHRPSDVDAAQEPPQIYGNNQIELS